MRVRLIAIDGQEPAGGHGRIVGETMVSVQKTSVSVENMSFIPAGMPIRDAWSGERVT